MLLDVCHRRLFLPPSAMFSRTYLCSLPTIYQCVLPWVSWTLLLTTLYSWNLLVSLSSSQPTLFADALYHEEPHNHQDQPLPSIQLYKMPDPKFFMKEMEGKLFHYTKSPTSCLAFVQLWCDVLSMNEDCCLWERSHIFKIPGLFEIIVKAWTCMTNEIVSFSNLGEGGLNHSFLVTL